MSSTGMLAAKDEDDVDTDPVPLLPPSPRSEMVSEKSVRYSVLLRSSTVTPVPHASCTVMKAESLVVVE